MDKQLNLFTETQLSNLLIGSKEWKLTKYNELIQLPFEKLEELETNIFEKYEILGKWPSEDDYWTTSVIIDICHYHYFEEFTKKYPRALVYKRKPPYLD